MGAVLKLEFGNPRHIALVRDEIAKSTTRRLGKNVRCPLCGERDARCDMVDDLGRRLLWTCVASGGDCLRCDGSGEIDCTCMSCDDDHYRECPDCDGSGADGCSTRFETNPRGGKARQLR